jgi:hypothetical protein
MPNAQLAPARRRLGLGDDPAVEITQRLNGVVPPSTLASLVQTYTSLDSLQQSAVLNAGESFLAGNPVNGFTALAPILAGALAPTGIGAAAIAVVAAAIPIVSAIFSALGIDNSPQSCAWKIGNVCFNGSRPAAPVDPNTGQPDPHWSKFSYFVQDTDANQAFPFYYNSIACELPRIDAALQQNLDPSTRNIYLFLKTYYEAWNASAERAINGHPSPSPLDLLTATAKAWNESHGADSSMLFVQHDIPTSYYSSAFGATQGTTQTCFIDPTQAIIDQDAVTYVSLVLNGSLGGVEMPSLKINTGPTPIKLRLGGKGKPAAASSTFGNVAVGTLAAAATTAAGLAIYARATRQPYKSVLKGTWSSAKGLVRR